MSKGRVTKTDDMVLLAVVRERDWLLDRLRQSLVKITLNDQLKAARATSKKLAEALRYFVDSYPDGEWRGLLHEEGCVGTFERQNERNELECCCDGDFHEDLTTAALADYSKEQP